MKNYRAVLLLMIVAALVVGSCRSRTDRSEGTVLLSISDFDGLPVSVSVTSGPFSIGQLTIRNIAKDPTGTTSSLMDVELRSFQVTYRRRDTGSRTPPVLSQTIFGNVPVNGTETILNLPFLTSDQTLSQPLRDLRDFGVDRETGTAVIVLDVTIQFFGRTISGDDVATQPASFTIEARR